MCSPAVQSLFFKEKVFLEEQKFFGMPKTFVFEHGEPQKNGRTLSKPRKTWRKEDSVIGGSG